MILEPTAPLAGRIHCVASVGVLLVCMLHVRPLLLVRLALLAWNVMALDCVVQTCVCDELKHVSIWKKMHPSHPENLHTLNTGSSNLKLVRSSSVFFCVQEANLRLPQFQGHETGFPDKPPFLNSSSSPSTRQGRFSIQGKPLSWFQFTKKVMGQTYHYPTQ